MEGVQGGWEGGYYCGGEGLSNREPRSYIYIYIYIIFLYNFLVSVLHLRQKASSYLKAAKHQLSAGLALARR